MGTGVAIIKSKFPRAPNAVFSNLRTHGAAAVFPREQTSRTLIVCKRCWAGSPPPPRERAPRAPVFARKSRAGFFFRLCPAAQLPRGLLTSRVRHARGTRERLCVAQPMDAAIPCLPCGCVACGTCRGLAEASGDIEWSCPRGGESVLKFGRRYVSSTCSHPADAHADAGRAPASARRDRVKARQVLHVGQARRACAPHRALLPSWQRRPSQRHC